MMIGDQPGQHFDPKRIDELAHLDLVAREHDQREDGEAKLQAQDHLAKHEQLRRAAFA